MTLLPKNQKSRNNTELASKIKSSILIPFHPGCLKLIYRQTNASRNVTYDNDMANIYDLMLSIFPGPFWKSDQHYP